MAVTTGMVGSGFYERNSAPQRAANEYVLPWLDAAIAAMALDGDDGVLGLADFGCSEGGNSIAVMQRAVDAARARTTRPIQTIHSDLPTNDFSHLMTGLRGDEGSVFAAPAVYSAAVGGTMFEQLLPPRSLHLATTFNAIGFLGQRPLDRLPGYILPNGPCADGVGAVSAPDRAAFAEQAAADLVAFLQARAAELVPGGKLLVQVFGGSDMFRTCDGIYDVLNDALLETVEAGLISQQNYEAFYQPVYFRDLAELTAPVAGEGAPLAGLYSLDRAETYEVPVPFNDEYARTGDLDRFAADYTNFYRAFTEPVLRLGFAGHDDIDGFVADVYGRSERRLKDDPDRYPFRYVAVAMLLTRLD